MLADGEKHCFAEALGTGSHGGDQVDRGLDTRTVIALAGFDHDLCRDMRDASPSGEFAASEELGDAVAQVVAFVKQAPDVGEIDPSALPLCWCAETELGEQRKHRGGREETPCVVYECSSAYAGARFKVIARESSGRL